MDILLALDEVALDERQAEDHERVVPTWRAATRPDHTPVGTSVPLQPLKPHRGLYLRLTAPQTLDGNRGIVTPLRCGDATRIDGAIEITWQDGGREVWELAGDASSAALRVRSRVEESTQTSRPLSERGTPLPRPV
ncbi:MAG: hypothetical protein SGJ11_10485 [Phycisphaerae bacterium]|nr:hypothetical protein [Phycisphaerae bacterium]